MSSRGRIRSRGAYANSGGDYGPSRDSDYKPQNYSSKSRVEKHSEERRREPAFSAKESSRPLEKRRGEEYSLRNHSTGKGDRHRDSMPSKRLSAEERHKESYSSREDRETNRPISKHSHAATRERQDSYSRERRESFSDKIHESFSMKGDREPYLQRPSHPTSYHMRESFSSRGGKEYYSSRGGKEYYSSRGGKEYYSSRGGREFFVPRGGGFGGRGGKEPFFQRGFGRGYRGSSFSMRGSRGDRSYSSNTGYEKLQLTKKLVASVLRADDGMEEYGVYKDRSYAVRGRDKEGRGNYMNRDTERRSFKDPRIQSLSSRPWRPDAQLIKRESLSSRFYKEQDFPRSSKMRQPDKYGDIRKRMMDQTGPPPKSMRLHEPGKLHGVMKRSSYEEGDHDTYPDKHGASSSHSREQIYSRKVSVERATEPLHEERVRPNERRVLSAKRSRERSSSSGSRREEKVRHKEKEEKGTSREREKSSEKDVKEDKKELSTNGQDSGHQKEGRETSPSGVQVTIRSDGERAVNSEGHFKPRISGKLFVDLQCPHCPGQRSVTFQEYRYHLDSKKHNFNIRDLAYKNSIVLRKIRLQQRNEQRDIEDKWGKENPEEFEGSVSRYCKSCKLAFKCDGEDNAKGIAAHNNSKLHKMQLRYLFPRCIMCRMSFPSRMVYEYHIASIRHLRMKTICREGDPGKDKSSHLADEREKEFGQDDDLANFITMDSVGEDEEIGSEADEITGNLEDIEAAEKEAKVDEEEEEEDEDEELKEKDRSLDTDGRQSPRRAVLEDDDLVELDLTNETITEVIDHDEEVFGKEYICSIKASYCKLCQKVIRTDTSIGFDAVDYHCRSALHLDNYHYLQSEGFMEEHGEGFEEAERLEEDYMAESDLHDEVEPGEIEKENEEEEAEGHVDEEEDQREEDTDFHLHEEIEEEEEEEESIEQKMDDGKKKWAKAGHERETKKSSEPREFIEEPESDDPERNFDEIGESLKDEFNSDERKKEPKVQKSKVKSHEKGSRRKVKS